jgi:biotin transport system substrate-specific component
MEKIQSIQKSSSIPFLKEAMKVIGGALFLALMAQVKLPLFFTPVPLTFQTFAAMMLGAFLGKKSGSLATGTYLAMILAGLPFVAGGIVDPLALVGPKGGYLIAMVAQSYLAGAILKRGASFLTTFFLLALVSLGQLTIGAAWLSTFVGLNNMVVMGMAPFIAGEAFKCFMVSAFYKPKFWVSSK